MLIDVFFEYLFQRNDKACGKDCGADVVEGFWFAGILIDTIRVHPRNVSLLVLLV